MERMLKVACLNCCMVEAGTYGSLEEVLAVAERHLSIDSFYRYDLHEIHISPVLVIKREKDRVLELPKPGEVEEFLKEEEVEISS